MKILRSLKINIALSICSLFCFCNESEIRLHKLLCQKDSYWDIHSYDAEVIAYGYWFKCNGESIYYHYNRDKRKRTKANTYEMNWNVTGDSILTCYYGFKYKILDINDDTIIIKSIVNKQMEVLIKNKEDWRKSVYPIRIYEYIEKRLPELQDSIDSLAIKYPQNEIGKVDKFTPKW